MRTIKEWHLRIAIAFVLLIAIFIFFWGLANIDKGWITETFPVWMVIVFGWCCIIVTLDLFKRLDK